MVDAKAHDGVSGRNLIDGASFDSRGTGRTARSSPAGKPRSTIHCNASRSETPQAGELGAHKMHANAFLSSPNHLAGSFRVLHLKYEPEPFRDLVGRFHFKRSAGRRQIVNRASDCASLKRYRTSFEDLSPRRFAYFFHRLLLIASRAEKQKPSMLPFLESNPT
jgi:hypothetical protein